MSSHSKSLLLVLGWIFLNSTTVVAGPPTLISRGYDGTPANGATINGALSGDGKTVCFQSAASNLITSDTNGVYDTFIWTKKLGTVLVSRSAAGAEGNRDSSGGCALSFNGRYLAFATSADNLHPNLEVNNGGIVVVDLKSGSRSGLSMVTNPSLDGENYRVANMSDDGRYVLFSAASIYDDAPGDAPDTYKWQWYLWDRNSNAIILVSRTPAGMPSDEPGPFSAGIGRISVDGRLVHFTSAASDLRSPPFIDHATRSYLFNTKNRAVSPKSANYGYESPDGSKFFKVEWKKGISVRLKGKKSFKLIKKMPEEIIGPQSVSRTGRYFTFTRNYGLNTFDTTTKKTQSIPGADSGILSRDGRILLHNSYRLFEGNYIIDLQIRTLAVEADR